MSRRIIRVWCRRLFVTLAVLFVIAGGAVAIFGLMPHPPEKGDVGVVIGSKVYSSGLPSDRLLARLDKAVELYHAGKFSVIIISGGVGDYGYNEAYAMADYLVQHKVPKSALVVDLGGSNTWSAARFAADYLKKHNLHSVVVVSQYFHLPRCLLAFRLAGIKEVGAVHPNYFEFRDFYSIAREVLLLISYPLRYSDS